MGKSTRPVAFIGVDLIAGLKGYKSKHITQVIKVTGATKVLLALPSAISSHFRLDS